MESLKILAQLAKEQPKFIAFYHNHGKIKVAMSSNSDEWVTMNPQRNNRVVSIWCVQ